MSGAHWTVRLWTAVTILRMAGWQHFRGNQGPGSHRELDAGRETEIHWRPADLYAPPAFPDEPDGGRQQPTGDARRCCQVEEIHAFNRRIHQRARARETHAETAAPLDEAGACLSEVADIVNRAPASW
jgi:hypothetical protein